MSDFKSFRIGADTNLDEFKHILMVGYTYLNILKTTPASRGTFQIFDHELDDREGDFNP